MEHDRAVHQWKKLVSRWWDRLIRDPGWTCSIAVDEFAGSRMGEVWIDTRHRVAEFRFHGKAYPDSEMALHEVCHVLIAPVVAAGYEIVQRSEMPLPELGHDIVENAGEAVVGTLTRLFMEMYEDGDKPKGVRAGNRRKPQAARTRARSHSDRKFVRSSEKYEVERHR